MSERARSMSGRVYRALLVAYPRGFREEYGAHMVQAFEDLCRTQSRREGAWGLAKLWARTLPDLVVSAGAERSGRMFEYSPGFVRWAGVAAMFAGFLGLFYTGLFEVLAMPGVLGPDGWDAGLSESARGYVDLLSGLLGAALVTVAIAGFRALLDRRSRLARAGLVIFCVATVVSVAISAYLRLVGPQLSFEEGLPLAFVIGNYVALIGAVGMLFLSIAALKSRTRPLGLWGVLPIVLAVLGTPLPMLLVASIGGSSIGLWTTILMAMPGILLNVGWMVLGYVLWSFGGELRYAAVTVGSAHAVMGTPELMPEVSHAGSARPEGRPARASGKRGRRVLLIALSSAALLVVGGAAVGTTQIGGDPGDNFENNLVGGEGDDALDGLGGGDVVRGEGGDDTLGGGYGDDEVRGGPGNDLVSGDFLSEKEGGGSGSIGRDKLYGEAGDDSIFADEKIIVGGEKDFVSCGPGKDFAEVSPTDVVAEDCEEVVRQELTAP